MGVVYLKSELESGHFPSGTGHEDAAVRLLGEVPLIDGVVTTMVHGSVPEGRYNRRSDLDVLVCHNSSGLREPEITREIASIFEDIEDSTGVRVEANIWPSNEHLDIRAGRMYDPLFVGHLAKSMINTDHRVGSVDPVIMDMAALAKHRTAEEMRQIILDYIVYKHTGFAKAPTSYQDASSCVAPFQRVLELPKATARKIIQMKEILGLDAGEGVLGLFEELSESGLSEVTLDAVRKLHGIDEECTSILEEFVRGEQGADQYGRWLELEYPNSID